LKEQGRFLEFQLRELISELKSFIRFRKNSPNLALEDIRSLLHLSSQRFQLLVFLHDEFGSHSGPLSSSFTDVA
ncbi:MAG: hypothetical protein ACFFCO_10215, partial [Promethearchaeota archaeon]